MHVLNFDRYPLVSIVLCTYNRAAYLERCIESVLQQTHAEWELLIVDDGSSDNTYEIADHYMSVCPHIRYLKHRNKKQALTRNVGIMASLGVYITFIDSDDLFKPNHIESRVKYMEQNPDVDMIQGGINIQEEIHVADYYHPDQLINIRDCVAGSTFFGKREVYFKIGGFSNIQYAEDAEFWSRAQRHFNLRTISAPETYLYSRAEDSITKLATRKITG